MLITPWVFCRYLIIGVYVGIATVSACEPGARVRLCPSSGCFSLCQEYGCTSFTVSASICAAQVGAFVTWYMFDNFMGIDLSKDGHSTVTWHQVCWAPHMKTEGTRVSRCPVISMQSCS
jgi:hypothetical protein